MAEESVTRTTSDEEKFVTGDNALFDTRQWANQPGGENVVLLFCGLAKKEYETILESTPDDHRILFRMGCLEYRSIWMDKSKTNERVVAAVAWFDQAIDKAKGDPNVSIYKALRALVLTKLEKWNEAVTGFEEALKALEESIVNDSSLSSATMEVAFGFTDVDKSNFKDMLNTYFIQCCERAGQWDQAKDFYKKQLEKSTAPDDPSTEFEKNCAEWKKVHDEDEGRSSSGSWVVAACAATCHKMGKWAVAEEWYRKSLQNESGYKTRHDAMGLMYPSEFFGRLHEGLGEVCSKQDNWEDAKLHRRIGKKTHPAEAAKYF